MADDNWSSTGPSEENKSAVSQCGMSTADVAAMTSAWADNMAAVQAAIIKAGRFNEQLMHGEYHVHQADQAPPCATFLRDACKPNATITNSAMMYGFTQVSESPHQPFLPNGSLPAFEQDLATFLLVATRLNSSLLGLAKEPRAILAAYQRPYSPEQVRGPFAWLGYGWLGCGAASGSCGHGPYVRPPELDLDYGEPIGHCKETSPDSGVFRREWTKASVEMDCAVGKYGEAKISMKSKGQEW